MNFILKIPDKYKIFSGSALKTIAIVSMLIDHFALVVLEYGILSYDQPLLGDTAMYTIYVVYMVMRNIGRLAFPIFCFVLIEGFLHTHNRRKYAIRLAIFALLSEIPYNLAVLNDPFSTASCNVFVTLLIGFLMMWAMDRFGGRLWIQAAIGLAAALLAYGVKSDYDYRGIILIFLLYIFRYNRGMQAITGSLSLYWEWPAIFAFIPICLYNGKKGRGMKYFFYLFYPAHLLLLYLFATILPLFL